MALLSIHPFPARMAPELASRSIEAVPDGGLVLDPMCGSGTVGPRRGGGRAAVRWHRCRSIGGPDGKGMDYPGGT